MASKVVSHVRFDFESDKRDVSGTQSLGGGVGDPRSAVVLEQDANIVDAKEGANPLTNHGLVHMQDFVGVFAWVVALENTLHNVNTNLTNMSTLFNQFLAHYALSVSRLVQVEGLFWYLCLLLHQLLW